MTKTRSAPLPSILFPGANSTERRKLARLKQEGRIRSIGPRLYASVSAQETAAAVRDNWALIASTLFPRALISHRTALEYRPGPGGEIHLTSTTNRVVEYPGLKLNFVRGPGPLEDDPRFLGMRASSLARALLENLSGERRSSPAEVVEARLENILRDGGDKALNHLRDRARAIAKKFGWKKEFKRLDGRIGALLGTRPASNARTEGGRARATGEPFDAACFRRLQILFGELRSRILPGVSETYEDPDHATNKAFFEAYFSNYIEGTTFEVAEAEEIVFNHKIPADRPKDAHDILGTYRIVSDPAEMARTAQSPDDLLERLVSRHRTIMERRPEARPGELKDKPNRAGETVFVHPDYVVGTLRRGHELYLDLPPGLSRAIFMMFLVADVHPFTDGNGRIARIMMNSELIARRQSTIIIPNVYRDDYLGALRSLTRRERPAPLVDALVRAQRFSHLRFSPYPVILKELQQRNWFREPDEARVDDRDLF